MSAAVISTKCRQGTPYRDYFCLCTTLKLVRPYGAATDPETTMTDDCGCIRLISNVLRVSVIDPTCERHRSETR